MSWIFVDQIDLSANAALALSVPASALPQRWFSAHDRSRNWTMLIRLRGMTVMRRAVLVVGLLSMGAKVAMAGQTQIVLQWLDTAQGSMDLREVYKVEDALEAVSGGKYFVDGHDVGSGTVNVFLYAEDSRVDSAISLVIRFFEQGKLPKGMRIGRAMYEDEKRRNWRFQPVYPPGLAEFRIMYPSGTASPK